MSDQQQVGHDSDGNAIALAYGLLWRMEVDLRRESDQLAVAARKELSMLLTPEGCRSGIERARRIEPAELRVRANASAKAEGH